MALPIKYGIEKKIDSMKGLSAYENGGKGSGNFGHSGRPGHIGGSGNGGVSSEPKQYEGEWRKVEGDTVLWSKSKDSGYRPAFKFKKTKAGKYALSKDDWDRVGDWMEKKEFDTLDKLMDAEYKAGKKQYEEKSRKGIF